MRERSGPPCVPCKIREVRSGPRADPDRRAALTLSRRTRLRLTVRRLRIPSATAPASIAAPVATPAAGPPAAAAAAVEVARVFMLASAVGPAGSPLVRRVPARGRGGLSCGPGAVPGAPGPWGASQALPWPPVASSCLTLSGAVRLSDTVVVTSCYVASLTTATALRCSHPSDPVRTGPRPYCTIGQLQ